MTELGTRACIIKIQTAHESYVCNCCNGTIQLSDGARVVANIYKKNKWDCVEDWHIQCYADAVQPYGDAPVRPMIKRKTNHLD